jgi:hypothetical protein
VESFAMILSRRGSSLLGLGSANHTVRLSACGELPFRNYLDVDKMKKKVDALGKRDLAYFA